MCMQFIQVILCMHPGSHIFCAMSAWTGSEGAPLFKTREKSGEPILVGIFSFSQSRPREKDEHESLSNVGSNIHYIKKHVTDKQWSSKGQISCLAHMPCTYNACSLSVHE